MKYYRFLPLVTLEVKILNKCGEEVIKSMFMNHQNESLLLVSIKQGFSASQMKCRSIKISDLKNGNFKGEPVFKKFILEYPDFIEFDDLNGKIVTKHSSEKVQYTAFYICLKLKILTPMLSDLEI